MPYCFPMSSVKFEGHMAEKIVDFDPNRALLDCNSSLYSPMAGYQMMHKAWSSIEEVPYCFEGHTALKIVEFYQNWPFSECNSSLNSPMAKKWCTKLEVAMKRCPIVCKVIRQISRSHGAKNCRIWPRLGVSGLKTPVWTHQWLQNDAQSLK